MAGGPGGVGVGEGVGVGVVGGMGGMGVGDGVGVGVVVGLPYPLYGPQQSAFPVSKPSPLSNFDCGGT